MTNTNKKAEKIKWHKGVSPIDVIYLTLSMFPKELKEHIDGRDYSDEEILCQREEARRVVNDFEEKKGTIYFKDGLNLVAVAPGDVLTKAVREDLKKYKLEILEILFKRNMDKGNDLVN